MAAVTAPTFIPLCTRCDPSSIVSCGGDFKLSGDSCARNDVEAGDGQGKCCSVTTSSGTFKLYCRGGDLTTAFNTEGASVYGDCASPPAPAPRWGA